MKQKIYRLYNLIAIMGGRGVGNTCSPRHTHISGKISDLKAGISQSKLILGE